MSSTKIIEGNKSGWYKVPIASPTTARACANDTSTSTKVVSIEPLPASVTPPKPHVKEQIWANTKPSMAVPGKLWSAVGKEVTIDNPKRVLAHSKVYSYEEPELITTAPKQHGNAGKLATSGRKNENSTIAGQAKGTRANSHPPLRPILSCHDPCGPSRSHTEEQCYFAHPALAPWNQGRPKRTKPNSAKQSPARPIISCHDPCGPSRTHTEAQCYFAHPELAPWNQAKQIS